MNERAEIKQNNILKNLHTFQTFQAPGIHGMHQTQD